MKLFKLFSNDESGAVTVDWVVLTAGVVLLAGLALTAIRGQVDGLGNKLTSAISATESAVKGS